MKKLPANKVSPTDIAFREEPSLDVNTDARSHARLAASSRTFSSRKVTR